MIVCETEKNVYATNDHKNFTQHYKYYDIEKDMMIMRTHTHSYKSDQKQSKAIRETTTNSNTNEKRQKRAILSCQSTHTRAHALHDTKSRREKSHQC